MEKNGFFEAIHSIGQNIRNVTDLTSAMIELPEGEVKTSYESKLADEALSSNFNSPSELALKKVMSTALAIAKAKELLPEGVAKDISGTGMASLVDDVVSRAKVAMKVAEGLDPYKGADILIDKAAARVAAIADVVVEKGVDLAIDKIGTVVTSVFPQAAPVVAVLKSMQHVITASVQKVVRKGIALVANVAKVAVRKIGEGVRKVASKVKNWLFG